MARAAAGWSLIFALTAALAAPAAAAPPLAVRFGAPAPGQLRGGEVLVLSAGSLAYAGPHPRNASIATPDACADACASTPGCSGWTFCGDGAAGCGAGCKAAARAAPKLAVSGISDAPQALPVTAFGPWTFPYASPDGCHPVKTQGGVVETSDAWPFGMCTLRKLPSGGGAGALAAAGDAKSGWVSGTIDLPDPPCAGLSAKACAACLASKNPAECVACARDARAARPSAAAYLSGRGADATRGCAVCANVTSGQGERDMCYACVLDAKPCATCALGATMYGTGPANVEGCLACARRNGPGLAAACNECAQSRAPARCLACLDSSYDLKTCAPPALGAPPAPFGSCREPGAPTPCARCANAAGALPGGFAATAAGGALFESCLSCFADPRRDSECTSCGELPEDAAGRGRCYACAAKAGFKSYAQSGCAACWGPLVSPGAPRAACVACAEGGAVAPDGKRFCSACAESDDGKERGACLACLAGRKAGWDQCAAGDGGARRLLAAEQQRRAVAAPSLFVSGG